VLRLPRHRRQTLMLSEAVKRQTLCIMGAHVTLLWRRHLQTHCDKHCFVAATAALSSSTNEIVGLICIWPPCCSICLSQRLSRRCPQRLLYTCQIVTDDISRQRFTPQTVCVRYAATVKPDDKGTFSCHCVVFFTSHLFLYFLHSKFQQHTSINIFVIKCWKAVALHFRG